MNTTKIALPDGLETKRLLLRLWKESDIPAFAAINADPEVMKHFPSTKTSEETATGVANIGKHFEANQFGLWAVEHKESKQLIGFIGLQRVQFEEHFTPAVEVGWRLSKDFWGMGLAPEGAATAIQDFFERTEMNEIISMTTTTNTNSMRVMEKLGMTRKIEEDFDHPAIPEGHLLRRHVLYRMSRNVWQTVYTSLG